MFSGNSRHFGNEIARTGLKVLKGIETEDIKPQVGRSIFSDDSDGTVLVTHFILADFSLIDHQSGKEFGEEEHKPKRGTNIRSSAVPLGNHHWRDWQDPH